MPQRLAVARQEVMAVWSELVGTALLFQCINVCVGLILPWSLHWEVPEGHVCVYMLQAGGSAYASVWVEVTSPMIPVISAKICC